MDLLPEFLDSWRELFFCIVGLPVALVIMALADRVYRVTK